MTEPHEPTEGSRRRKRQIGLPVVIDVGLALSFHVPDLKIWTSYEVEVRAVTVVPGPFSKKVAVRTDEDGKVNFIMVENVNQLLVKLQCCILLVPINRHISLFCTKNCSIIMCRLITNDHF